MSTLPPSAVALLARYGRRVDDSAVEVLSPMKTGFTPTRLARRHPHQHHNNSLLERGPSSLSIEENSDPAPASNAIPLLKLGNGGTSGAAERRAEIAPPRYAVMQGLPPTDIVGSHSSTATSVARETSHSSASSVSRRRVFDCRRTHESSGRDGINRSSSSSQENGVELNGTRAPDEPAVETSRICVDDPRLAIPHLADVSHANRSSHDVGPLEQGDPAADMQMELHAIRSTERRLRFSAEKERRAVDEGENQEVSRSPSSVHVSSPDDVPLDSLRRDLQLVQEKAQRTCRAVQRSALLRIQKEAVKAIHLRLFRGWMGTAQRQLRCRQMVQHAERSLMHAVWSPWMYSAMLRSMRRRIRTDLERRIREDVDVVVCEPLRRESRQLRSTVKRLEDDVSQLTMQQAMLADQMSNWFLKAKRAETTEPAATVTGGEPLKQPTRSSETVAAEESKEGNTPTTTSPLPPAKAPTTQREAPPLPRSPQRPLSASLISTELVSVPAEKKIPAASEKPKPKDGPTVVKPTATTTAKPATAAAAAPHVAETSPALKAPVAPVPRTTSAPAAAPENPVKEAQKAPSQVSSAPPNPTVAPSNSLRATIAQTGTAQESPRVSRVSFRDSSREPEQLSAVSRITPVPSNPGFFSPTSGGIVPALGKNALEEPSSSTRRIIPVSGGTQPYPLPIGGRTVTSLHEMVGMYHRDQVRGQYY